MRSPAVFHLGFAVMAACWSGQGDSTTTPQPTLEAARRDVTGPYWCSIDDAGYEYPRYPCLIKTVGNKLVLAKLGGTQRIRGHIVLDKQDGFTFVGELYCPWGDCTEQLRGRFRPTSRGGFKGTLRGPLDHGGGGDEGSTGGGMIVQLIPAPANAFGGNGYGGDGYGDPFGYRGPDDGAEASPVDTRGGRR
ncbi:MAG TPA: hypothetical protein VK427_08725 [Kofleriaceae bacterium]|nr:hypothetical protein [Kofleriaceae bacterium]